MRSPLRPLTRTGWLLTQRTITVPPTASVPDPVPMTLPGRGETVVVDTGVPDGEPVFLLHALACTGLLTWYPALPTLGRRHRVIILDQRCHGRGIRSNTFSLSDCVDDVLALADALGIERFTVAGYSMGGLVGQLLARQAPERVRGLVLCATAATFRRNRRHNAVLDAFAGTAAMWQARAKLAVMRGEPAEKLTDHRWLYAQFRSTSPAEIMAAIDVIGRYDSTSWLREITVPTSVVVTAKDRAIPAGHQRWVSRAIPNANAFEIAAGHAACVFRPGQFVPALAAACASVHTRHM